MLLPDRLLPRCILVAVAQAGLLVVPSPAADETRPAAGSATQSPRMPLVPRKTREELIREWDLDKDGKIEAGEAEIASSRMRLERAKMRLNRGFDPVTGRPRDEPQPEGEPAEDEERPDDDLAAELDAETPPSGKKPAARPTTSGTQSSARNAALVPLQRPLPMSGGVRAGAQAARPGYGAASAPSLNAGRPLAATPPADATRPRNAAASAQLQGGPSRSPAQPMPGSGAAAQRPRGGLLPRPPLQPPPRSRDLYDPY